MRYFYQFLSLLNASLMVSSFKWTLNENIAKNVAFRCTEGYMFANGNGPPMLEQGAAYINIDARATVYMRSNHSAIVKLAVFAVNQEYHQNNTLPYVCSSDTQEPDWATNVSDNKNSSHTRFERVKTIIDDILISACLLWINHLQSSNSF
jgi:hypothetical protein